MMLSKGLRKSGVYRSRDKYVVLERETSCLRNGPDNVIHDV